MEFIEVCPESDITNGNMKYFNISNTEILVANVDGKFYSIYDRCTHLRGDLSKGKLEGKIITCPRHGSQFDVTTGENIRGPQVGLFKLIKKVPNEISFEVRVEDGKIKVAL